MGNPPSHIPRGAGRIVAAEAARFEVSVLEPGGVVGRGRAGSLRMGSQSSTPAVSRSLAIVFIETRRVDRAVGDTRRPELIDLAQGADTLVMMCWDEQPRSWLRGWTLPDGTGSAGELCGRPRASAADPTHINPRSPASARARNPQAGEAFAGEILVADELVRLLSRLAEADTHAREDLSASNTWRPLRRQA